MTQYVDKSALVAEIERIKANIKEYCVREGHDRRFDVVPEQLAQILSFIDTLETKEVDEEYNGKAMLHVLEKGVEQGRRELIDKACDWLSNVSIEDISYKYDDFDTSEGWYKFIEDFRKAMKT